MKQPKLVLVSPTGEITPCIINFCPWPRLMHKDPQILFGGGKHLGNFPARSSLLLALVAATGVGLSVNAIATVRITEFMASNSRTLQDEDGDYPDWIEIHNSGFSPVNLAGWHLTDDTNQPTRWRFPEVSLAADSYLVVFASDKNRAAAGSPLHTNFRLSAGGEYLALFNSAGVAVSEFAPAFPPQVADVSYGLGFGPATELPLLPPGAPARAFVPANDSLGLTWTEVEFNDAAWLSGTTGVGYDRTVSPVNYLPLIGLNVESQMYNQTETVYVRVPFVVENPAGFNSLTLRMRYEDGFAAYLNGEEIARDNAPATLTYNSGATAVRDDNLAIEPRDFDVSAYRDLLQAGTNLLAIHALNRFVGSSDLLCLPEVIATRQEEIALRYFTAPTPGAPNHEGAATLGPIISEVSHSPTNLPANSELVVTARVRPALAPVGNVRLRYRVMFDAEMEVTMFDDGNNGDGAAGDGVYGAPIPASAFDSGQMVRYFILATDTQAASSRLPVFSDPAASPEYFGTVVLNPTLTNALPVLHWFVVNPSAAGTDTGTRSSLFFNGEFYDNVFVRRRGNTSAGWPKRNYKFDFNPGHNFRFAPDTRHVNEINLNSTYSDKSYIRQVLSWETYRDAGTPYSESFPLRLQQNNAFFSVAVFVEQPDRDYLRRNQLDPNGALYKMFNSATSSSSNVEKKTRREENHSDLQALVSGIAAGNPNRLTYLFDNVNLAAAINYLAASVLVHENDHISKNYYLYRDTEGTGEWRFLPWDKDLTFGRNFVGDAGGVLSDVIYADNDVISGRNSTVSPSHPLFGDDQHQKWDNLWNRLIDALHKTPAVREMYLRRLRTLMDELLQPPGTPAGALKFETRLNELQTQMHADVLLDRARWGNPYGQNQDFQTALNLIRNSYLPPRRVHLFNNHNLNSSYPLSARIPDTQPANPVIRFGARDVNPASGNQAHEFIELINTNNYAVDLSGWQLSGDVNLTFQPGTVMRANSSLFASPDPRAFRTRAISPTGGQGRFVQGPYTGQLSERGGVVRLLNAPGAEVAVLEYEGQSLSAAQQFLRITEIMYHPAPPPPGGNFGKEEFEFLELKNIGASSLHLTDVRFTEGIAFSFPASGVTNLGPGEYVLVVRNRAAFESRYGTTHPVAGEYTGNLDNAGERLRLEDAVGEVILDFAYDDEWYPITDGGGFSLVIVNEHAPWSSWGESTSWRPSVLTGGAPGQSGTAPNIPPIRVNELLAHTSLPQTDAVELFNPTTEPVSVGGWFLTDNFANPKKFRIPDDTIIPAGGYLVFDENDFNPTPGTPPSFAFSSLGEQVFLLSADLAGNLTGYAHGYVFGASENGVSFGRHVISTGEEHFVGQTALTLGATNAGPRVGPVVINELMYHPPPGAPGTDALHEYIELHNLTGGPVPLFDPEHPTNRWLVTNGVDFVFPQGMTLPARGYLLVVGFDPVNSPAELAAFRLHYGLSSETPIIGPFNGRLSNSGESLELCRPFAPEADGSVPILLVDQVHYSDLPPWPVDADGQGSSLQRLRPGEYGNDPANWLAALPTPGAVNDDGSGPFISSVAVSAGGNSAIITWNTAAPASAQIVYGTSEEVDRSSPIRHSVTTNHSVLLNALSAGTQYYFRAISGADNLQYLSALHTFSTAGEIIIDNPAAEFTGLWSTGTLSGGYLADYRFAISTNTEATATASYRPVITTPGKYDVFVWYLEGGNRSTNVPVEIVHDGGSFHASFSQLLNGSQWVALAGGLSFARGSNGFVRFSNDTGETSRVVIADAVRFVYVAAQDHPAPGEVPSWWVEHYFNGSVDPGIDHDLDGHTTAEEYVLGTDPTNPESRLQFQARLLAGSVEVRFAPWVENRLYQLETRTDLSPAPWTILTNVPVPIADGEGVFTTISPPAARTFYRLRVRLAP